jgi:lysine 6-dehydrogenase
MGLLMDSGYFAKEKVRAGEVEVSPLEVSWAVLGRKLAEGDPRDMTVMRVIARGRKRSVVYDMLDKYDEEERVSSMAKTTAYTASIVTQMLGSGEIKGSGTIPPEVAIQGRQVEKVISELARRGVKIRRSSGK